MSDNPAPLGRLKNVNPRGNPANSPRCGAKTRAGSPCRQERPMSITRRDEPWGAPWRAERQLSAWAAHH